MFQLFFGDQPICYNQSLTIIDLGREVHLVPGLTIIINNDNFKYIQKKKNKVSKKTKINIHNYYFLIKIYYKLVIKLYEVHLVIFSKTTQELVFKIVVNYLI
jgi:hypothetical protein